MLLGTPISSPWRAQVGNATVGTAQAGSACFKTSADETAGGQREAPVRQGLQSCCCTLWCDQQQQQVSLLSLSSLSHILVSALTLEFNSPLLECAQAAPQKHCFSYTQARPTWDPILNQPELNSVLAKLLLKAEQGPFKPACYKRCTFSCGVSQRLLLQELPQPFVKVCIAPGFKEPNQSWYHALLLFCSVPRHAYHTLTVETIGTCQDLHYNSPSLLSEENLAIREKQTNNEAIPKWVGNSTGNVFSIKNRNL